jgi:DNA-binding winged helix-turn-helix (wHTH) protein/TolB-like protein
MDSRRFLFGLFEFDTATLELRREGVPIRLQSQPAQVLACLIEEAGRVVSREDLCKAVWGEKTFVNFEGSLNFCVSQVRSALQDNPLQPNYIRTVPKSGYQFIAPVCPLSAKLSETGKVGDTSPRVTTTRIAVLLLSPLVMLIVIAFAGLRLRFVRNADQSPIVAISRFDNETGNSALSRFADTLTDTVVEQMTNQTSTGYRVIGNAQILRLPREQRDLPAIASSLNASYVVLGQVQSNGAQVRILAHLIRLSDQTHICVVRMDRPIADVLQLNSEVAHRIAAEFSARMLAKPGQAASFSPANH